MPDEVEAGKKRFSLNEWLLITADQQTEGIGQHDQNWQFPLGNLYATFMIPWPLDAESKLICLPQTVTISISQCLEDSGLMSKIKWVNDVIINVNLIDDTP